eukprot:g29008.t1
MVGRLVDARLRRWSLLGVLVLWSRSAGVLDAATTTGATTGPVDTDWTLEETDEEGVPLSMVADVSQVAEQLGLNGEVEPLADRLTLLRFYLHRDRQVASAVQMYRETIAWRQAFNLKQVMADYGHGEAVGAVRPLFRGAGGSVRRTWHPNAPAAIHVEPFVFFGRLPSPAPDGGPVLVWRAGLADYGGFVREELVDEMIRAYVAHFEDALQSARSTSRGRLVRARVVVDAQGFDLVNLRYLQVLHHIMRLMQDHFPEVSASVTVVRAPWSVVKLYELLKPWLSQHVQQKVCFLAEDFAAGLWAHARLKLAMLPQFLGGHYKILITQGERKVSKQKLSWMYRNVRETLLEGLRSREEECGYKTFVHSLFKEGRGDFVQLCRRTFARRKVYCIEMFLEPAPKPSLGQGVCEIWTYSHGNLWMLGVWSFPAASQLWNRAAGALVEPPLVRFVPPGFVVKEESVAKSYEASELHWGFIGAVGGMQRSWWAGGWHATSARTSSCE